jgi:CelD/BcsL family acetyltransferase involved in cellulose biosynthesis
MKSIICDTIDKKIIDDWQSLWERSSAANYTNSPLWFQSVMEMFKFKKFVIIAIYDEEKLVAAGALVRKKKYGVDFFTAAPEDFVCGIPFLIDINDTTVISEFTKQLATLGNIFLTNIPEEFLTELQKYTIKINAVCQAPNYYLPVKKDFNGFAELNKRNKLLHQVRNIGDKFTLRTFEGTSNEGLNTVFSLDQQSSKQGKGYNTFDSDSIREFYKVLGKNFKKHLLINIMYFENEPIAYEIGFFINNNYFGSQTAYNSDYRQYSPGKVIFVRLVDFLASRNAQMWDLGSGESLVKQMVTDKKRELYQITITQSIFVRSYSKKIEKLKIGIFNQSRKHWKLYSVYRKIRKIKSH